MSPTAFLELSFDLGSLDAEAAEQAACGCGAIAVTFVDARDEDLHRAVLEPAPGEMPLWSATRVKCLFEGSALALRPTSRNVTSTC